MHTSSEEVEKHILAVDRKLRDGREVDATDKRIDLSALYKRYSWGNGPTPLSDKAQRALKLADRTSDERWSRAFQDGRHLGVYRSNIGYYWVLRYDGSLSTHALVHAGTAADVTAKFGR
ncbi:MAG: hypothetical protein VYE22_36670 [Myxococcota bacterium]|nr:hypothetical protein [Myxococcota bacterium]